MQIKKHPAVTCLATAGCLINLAVFATVVDLCQATFAGFPETVIQIDAGFLHSAADHIIADISGTGKEVA